MRIPAAKRPWFSWAWLRHRVGDGLGLLAA